RAVSRIFNLCGELRATPTWRNRPQRVLSLWPESLARRSVRTLDSIYSTNTPSPSGSLCLAHFSYNRKLLAKVHLPKESQQIDRVMESFAKRWHACNPGLMSSAGNVSIVYLWG